MLEDTKYLSVRTRGDSQLPSLATRGELSMRNECGQRARPSSLKRSNLWLEAGKLEADKYLMFDAVGNVEYDKNAIYVHCSPMH